VAERNGARQPTAIEFAIAVVSSRSLPEKKLRERLAPRYDVAEVDAAMARMRELRLVDDAAWAERFARDRFERVGKGRHRIRNELLARGIDAATAEASLAAVLGGDVGGDVEREKAAAMLETMRSKLGRGAASRKGARNSPGADGAEDSHGTDGAEDTPGADGAQNSHGARGSDDSPPEAAPSTPAGRSAARHSARRASESLKNRLFRRMLARGYPASLVRDLLDVS
jgi:regulatory protein